MRPWTSAGSLAIVRLGDEEDSTLLTAASTGWVVGIAIGVVVIAVAAVIVIVIVSLAMRISTQAATAEKASRWSGSRPPSSAASRGSTTRAPGSCTPPARFERRRSDDERLGGRAGDRLVAALVVAALLVLLLVHVGRIQRSVRNLLETAGKVGANTANIPQLEATAPVLALIVEEAVVQDGYMNALTDGFGQDA